MIFLKNEIIFIFQNCKKMNDPKTHGLYYLHIKNLQARHTSSLKISVTAFYFVTATKQCSHKTIHS